MKFVLIFYFSNINPHISESESETFYPQIRLYDQDVPRDQEYGFTWLAQVIGTSTITVKDLDCPHNKPNVYTMQPGDIG